MEFLWKHMKKIKKNFFFYKGYWTRQRDTWKGVLSPIWIVINLQLTYNTCCVQNNSLLIKSRFGMTARPFYQGWRELSSILFVIASIPQIIRFDVHHAHDEGPNLRTSYLIFQKWASQFLDHIQEYSCGSIQSSCGSTRYLKEHVNASHLCPLGWYNLNQTHCSNHSFWACDPGRGVTSMYMELFGLWE